MPSCVVSVLPACDVCYASWLRVNAMMVLIVLLLLVCVVRYCVVARFGVRLCVSVGVYVCCVHLILAWFVVL